MPSILLIDDDERLAELLGRYFTKHGLMLDFALRPSVGLARLSSGGYDLVILDVMLPEKDGFEVCRDIRVNSDVPIIMLTARGEVMDRVVGLELGADDYLPKPFEPRELVARIQRILKRSARNGGGNVLKFGALTIDTELQSAALSGENLSLTSMEYRLLTLLATRPGKTFSRDEILNQLKGIETEIFSRSVDILVSRLRQKLRPGDFIRTVRSNGYCFLGKSE
ncbi:response regulator transcription factor [Candidatus Methylospira mobilis]|uniref:Response regulator transcription factor n=1 Tax=Candidatus Methylospira mobilis TaxID=1808979 RepID=A0A5Q0BPS9_9GAMM|nr:response regulator transcription factor [Candidatus Methylospira mobilis]QFY44087.1 response regulator transcription factor [Candidatus Methylospira mobilis]WNV06511.1 response regulator transcription factor [Candidatus Methylospira mobilis]